MATSNYKFHNERIQNIKSDLLCINSASTNFYGSKWSRQNDRLADEMSFYGWQRFNEILEAAVKAGQDFIQSICATIKKYDRISEKQAYCLARFAADNQIVFEGEDEDVVYFYIEEN